MTAPRLPTVTALGEVGMIERIRRRLPRPRVAVKGIGDDAAVLPFDASRYLLFASDMLIEHVHFQRATLPAPWIGWKALACNVSDVAAMGGMPRYGVVSLGLPRHTPVRFVDGLYQGLARCATHHDMEIVGGDTVRAPCVVIDVAILGTVEKRRLVLRSGARVGDRVFVTGRLGAAEATMHHATFRPRLAEAQWLVRRRPIHAMMDLSDGLASDLWQLARASGVTMQIRERAIPTAKVTTVWHALMDGEDFELLFTVAASTARRLPPSIGPVPLTDIGTVTKRGVGVELVHANGRITRLIPKGFRHF